jgi:DNA-binding beta-propeller fold protein YncE
MKHLIQALLTATVIAGTPAIAQTEIPFDSVPNALQLPAGLYLGEVGGVATNSRGDIFVYTRTGHPTITTGTARPFAHGGSRLFQFDRTGKFVREIGKDSYGFMFAAQVRVDPSDNIWVVDQMTNMVIKFDPQGRVVLLLGRKAESVPVPARQTTRGDGSGQPTDLFDRPTDVAWDAAGNIYVADGLGNA